MSDAMHAHEAANSGHEHVAHSCTMNSSFTWDYDNICVIFPWWRIRSVLCLVLSCIAIAAWAYSYEYMKYYIRKNHSGSKGTKLRRSIWYGAQVSIAFLIMLIMMTYNGWLMLSVVVGAIAGHYHWEIKEGGLLDVSLACH
ncbi:AaceriAER293Cp [[Ashbya] aceris (nom. inval.)]|nr:AaceriAER293Cp [[Ashbya] aceris (nom. inval.)]